MSGVRFIYIPCSELPAMRRFYTDLVGLDEVYHSEEDRSVAYDCDGLQFSIFETELAVPSIGWATQPGWAGGTSALASWSVHLDDEPFHAAVARLQAAGVESFHEAPQWVNYWSFPVTDPMGNTVELTHAPGSG